MKQWHGLVKIVLDTNIIISGLMSYHSPPALLLRYWLDEKFILLTSHDQISEIRRVLDYDHIQSRISFIQKENILKNIYSEAIVLNTLPFVYVSPDADDNIILATAVAGHANLIVSGDKAHMLAIKFMGNIPIVTARDALDMINNSR